MSNSTYTDYVLSYWDDTLMGEMTAPTNCAEEVNPLCGDTVFMSARVCNGGILRLEFNSKCCCMAQCAAAMLVERFRGRTVESALAFTEEEMRELFKAQIPPARVGCVMLPLKCLHKLFGQAKDS